MILDEQIEASKRPKSDWIEAEKALYRDVLKNRTFDILIIPFKYRPMQSIGLVDH